MRYVLILWVFTFFFGCGKGDDGPPPSPEGALLVFPEQNSECNTGIDISTSESQVTFQWQVAANTDRYSLTVVNLISNTPQTISTAGSSAALTIAKGAPFSWSVLSSNSASDETATSESWLFYNAGAQTTYAPFPAQINSPQPGSTAQADINNQIVLSWTGADVEDDIERFEVYLAEVNPPEQLLTTTNSETQQATTNVVSGTTYYWRVVTIDAAGNSSDSGIFDFRVL